MAVELILDGRLAGTAAAGGVTRPITREWYGPMLDGLEAEGIKMVEEVVVVVPPTRK